MQVTVMQEIPFQHPEGEAEGVECLIRECPHKIQVMTRFMTKAMECMTKGLVHTPRAMLTLAQHMAAMQEWPPLLQPLLLLA